MQIKISVIDVTVEDKGKYKVARVTYRNDGKIQEKQLFSFGDQKDAYLALTSLKDKELSVTAEKNDKGYWDWIKVVPASEATSQATNTGGSSGTNANPTPRSNYETPEERAKRQEYIIRQSSLERALELLTLQGAKKSSVAEVCSLAAEFEGFVFNGIRSIAAPAAGKTVVETLPDLESDIPF